VQHQGPKERAKLDQYVAEETGCDYGKQPRGGKKEKGGKVTCSDCARKKENEFQCLRPPKSLAVVGGERREKGMSVTVKRKRDHARERISRHSAEGFFPSPEKREDEKPLIPTDEKKRTAPLRAPKFERGRKKGNVILRKKTYLNTYLRVAGKGGNKAIASMTDPLHSRRREKRDTMII